MTQHIAQGSGLVRYNSDRVQRHRRWSLIALLTQCLHSEPPG